MKLRAPAKVNFGLRVTAVRPDGYHELESLFLPLDLADELEIELEEAPSPGVPAVSLALEGGAEGVPGGDANLASRAAAGFLAAAGLERRVSIRLAKRLPAAAGLGGGSSDAGAVLRGLDALLPGALDGEALAALALSLGADVPFFLDPRPALVSGIGERCEPLAGSWPSWTLLLVNPGEPLATAAVFAAYDRGAGVGPGAPAPGSRRPFREQVEAAVADPRALPALLENDLEGPALGLCPAIGELRERLRGAGALAVGLSGSGATLFGVFPGPQAAEAARQGFAGPCWARVARTAESR
ncbi:MAG: 4-(cytidine 5'-diphospho)-2-C-methyl-D-erythritol kinase [Myxococcota bacterium]|nr:4-(cytidine 5'-diphospho)-2-C-methyl-D-erythritol kinase [Myxococcota bacterium]